MHTHNDFQETSHSAWRDRLLIAGAAIVFGLTLSNVAPADDASRDAKRAADSRHDAAVKKAHTDYKAARARCNDLAGNEKDVCIKQAKADEKRAKAEAKADKKSTAAHADANADKRDAEFKVAKEKCDSMSGNAKDVCQKDAEAKYRH